MKKLISIFSLFVSVSVSAQNYGDSTITLQMPRVFSWWITKSIESQITRDNFRMVDILKPYVSDSTKPDSLFTVSLKAKYVQQGMELLITRPSELAFVDRLKIVTNQKVGATGNAIASYTGIASQITTKANGATSEKQVAIYLRDWYISRQGNFTDLYREERDAVIKLVKQ